MWKNTFNKEENCPKFLRDPTMNPATGRKITKDGDVYKWLVENCGGRENVEKVAGKQRKRVSPTSGSRTHGGIRQFVKETSKLPMGKFLDRIIQMPEFSIAICKSFNKAKREATDAVLPKIMFEFYGRKIMIASKGPLAEKLTTLCRGAALSPKSAGEEEVELKAGENFCKTANMKKIRSKAGFEPQSHQIKAQEFMRKNERLMLYHGLGAGKTCTATMIMTDYMKRTPQNNLVYFISPGGLRRNFTEEFCTFCPEDRRLIENDKFVGRIRLFSLDDSSLKRKLPEEFANCLVVIDEAHRLIDAPSYRDGDGDETSIKNLEVLFEMLTEHQRNNKVKLVLMTGTPFPDSLEQHYNCLKLLKPNEMKITYEQFESLFVIRENMYYPKNKTVEKLYENCISYYATDVSDVPSSSYSDEIVAVESDSPIGDMVQNAMDQEESIRRKPLQALIDRYMKTRKMDKIEARKQAILDKFRAATCNTSRRYSNFIYPRKGMTDADLFADYTPEQILQISPKLQLLITNLQDNAKCPGKQLVYSPFKEFSGVNLIGKLLTSMGISNMVYSGDVSNSTRSSYLQKFNSPENDNGDIVKVMLITDAAAEGISLLTTRGVHLFNESIYASHMSQVIGRAIRFRSHVRLPQAQRTVAIFRYRLFVKSADGATSNSPDQWCYEAGLRRELLLKEIDKLVKTEWSIEKR